MIKLNIGLIYDPKETYATGEQTVREVYKEAGLENLLVGGKTVCLASTGKQSVRVNDLDTTLSELNVTDGDELFVTENHKSA